MTFPLVEYTRQVWVRHSPMPERIEVADTALDRMCLRLGEVLTRSWGRSARRAEKFARKVLIHAESFASISDDALRCEVDMIRREISASTLEDDELASKVFALVREQTYRVKGIRHHPCQLIGGWVMLKGMLAEMATGEGKTITALLTAATAGLAGIPVHVVTVNDYLAERDSQDLRPVYEALGLTVGLVINGLSPEQKRLAYAQDIVYCSNKELTFDYLRDRIAMRPYRTATLWNINTCFASGGRMEEPMMRGLHFAIVDEADSVLVDEARTPLIISSERKDKNSDEYRLVLEIARELQTPHHFSIQSDSCVVTLTQMGRDYISRRIGERSGILSIPAVRDDLSCHALMALHVFQCDQHYIVRDGKVQIVDESTGRTMADRSWERGLHQMVELKEGCELTGQREAVARMTYQRFFRRYIRLSGMTGTAREVSGELREIYRLKTVYVPTHKTVIRKNVGTTCVPTVTDKWRKVVAHAQSMIGVNRSVLIGTRSVAASEELSRQLTAAGIIHTLLNARQDADEAESISMAGMPGRITVATNMAGRGTDIKLDESTRKAGGLHVILTEFHESSRIDRQLFGRAGRQGDPGTVECIVSHDDELFNRFMPLSYFPLSLRYWFKGIVLRFSGPDLLRILAQRAAESQFREQRIIGFNQTQATDDRFAFAGHTE